MAKFLYAVFLLVVVLAFPATAHGSFRDSIGVNFHATYTGTAYTRAPNLAILDDLGIRHIRDAVVCDPGAIRLDGLRRLQGLNRPLSLIVGGPPNGTPTAPPPPGGCEGRVAEVMSAIRSEAPNTVQVEGFNEPDLWNGCCRFDQYEIDRTVAHQQSLYANASAGFDVAAPSIAFNSTTPPLFAGIAEVSNTHPYAKPGWETPSHAASEYNRALGWTGGQQPVDATEYGWRGQDGSTSTDVVTEVQQRDRGIAGIFELLKTGYRRVYWYELYDQSDRWGIVNYNASTGVTRVKPIGVALDWTLATLGEAVPASTSWVSVSGTGVRSSEWVRPDGSHVIALWRSADGSGTVSLWDRSGGPSSYEYRGYTVSGVHKKSAIPAQHASFSLANEPMLITMVAR